MSFAAIVQAALIQAALDAAGYAPFSAPARWALDRAHHFARYYGFRRLPTRVDAQDAALSVAILAEAETRRGVRTVRG